MTLPSEASAELFRAIAEYTYDWESWVDSSGITRWVNSAVERISGYSVSDCLSHADYPLFLAYPDDRTLLSGVLLDAARGGSGNDVEFRIQRKDGELRWVAISWQAVRTTAGEPLGYRTSVRDIDQRKHIEAELHAMRKRAESHAQARTELLANVSHELRSPAHVIAGFAELLQHEPLTPTQQRYVQRIAEQCVTMQRQVEDLLSLTALEAGGVELVRAPVDLHALIEGLLDACGEQATRRGLQLSHQLHTKQRWFLGDGLRLQQVLRNLLDNALKFTEHGSVRVVVYEHDQQLVFEVIDSGIGMAQDEVSTLLLPFRQADNSTQRRHGGVGLGLAIVDRLVGAMGGTLALESARGQGTTVRVALPLEVPSVVPHAVTAETLHARVRGRALVVDDSAPARELLADMLQLCGFTCITADSARAAEQAVQREPFDVLFLDYQMPDSDGAETAVTLRRVLLAQAPERHVPIYILTANVFVHEQLRDARSAVDGILTKPLSRAGLAQVLRQLPEQKLENIAEKGANERPSLDAELVHELRTTRARNGQTLLTKLLPSVEIDMQQALAQLREQLSSASYAQATRTAHAAAGHTALVGALRARDHARALEELLHDEEDDVDTLAALALLEACEEAWALALRELRED